MSRHKQEQAQVIRGALVGERKQDGDTLPLSESKRAKRGKSRKTTKKRG